MMMQQQQGPISIPVATPVTAGGSFQNIFYSRPRDSGNRLGSGNVGVEGMQRIILALECEISSEVDWAISEILQLSNKSPNHLHLKHMPDLVDLLLSKLQLYLGQWDTSLRSNSNVSHGLLDNSPSAGANRDAMMRQKCLELLLAIRNMALDPENAFVLANMPELIQLVENRLSTVFSASGSESSTMSEFRASSTEEQELSKYLLELVESLSPHITPVSLDDVVYSTVIKVASTTSDRAHLLSALHTLTRLAVHEPQNLVGKLPEKLITRILRLLLVVDDEPLLSAVLDVLYQFSLRIPNVTKLLEGGNQFACEVLTHHLIRLLSYGFPQPELKYADLPRVSDRESPPELTPDILEELVELEEPLRATTWIRCTYEDDPHGEVTQVSLWRAYENQFLEQSRAGWRLLPAVDFIKNVTTAIPRSAAMVVHKPDGNQKFIIKGIRRRELAITPAQFAEEQIIREAEDKKLYAQQRSQAEPSSIGVSAALVLQNIACSRIGRPLLKGCDHQLTEVMSLNPGLAIYIEFLLDTIYSVGDLG